MLDFTPLAKAISTLASATGETASRPTDLLACDGCIQRFAYTYELCVKSLRRQMEESSDSPAEIDALGYRDTLRVLAQRGFIADVLSWFGFRELRNITSHAYDSDKATRVFDGIPAFLEHALQLLVQIVPIGKGPKQGTP